MNDLILLRSIVVLDNVQLVCVDRVGGVAAERFDKLSDRISLFRSLSLSKRSY